MLSQVVSPLLVWLFLPFVLMLFRVMQFFRDRCGMFTLNTRSRHVNTFCGQMITEMGFTNVNADICSVCSCQHLLVYSIFNVLNLVCLLCLCVAACPSAMHGSASCFVQHDT